MCLQDDAILKYFLSPGKQLVCLITIKSYSKQTIRRETNMWIQSIKIKYTPQTAKNIVHTG